MHLWMARYRRHITQTAKSASPDGPLTRYVNMRVAHVQGMPGTFSTPPTSKESRHVRHARAVMHVGIADPRWREKRSRHSRRTAERETNHKSSAHLYRTCYMADMSVTSLYSVDKPVSVLQPVFYTILKYLFWS